MASLGSALSAAVNLFLVTIYAPFTVSSLLSAGQPELATFYAVATLLAMALGTLISGHLSRTALVLAPAIGMTLIMQKVVSEGILSYRQALFASVVAGILSVLFALRSESGKSLRFHILSNIPGEIKLGIKSGVGALLATQALENFSELTGPMAPYAAATETVLALWVGAVFILLLSDLKLRVLPSTDGGAKPDIGSALMRWVCLSATAIVGLLLAWVGWGVGNWPATESGGTDIVSMLQNSAGSTLRLFCSPLSDFTLALPLTLLFLFLFLTDIPGTPYEMLGVAKTGKTPSQLDESVEINRSFFADATMAILNPILRIPPSIYYAENVVLERGHEDQIKNSFVAVLCAALYLAIAVALISIEFDVESFRTLSLFAVSPILFYIGIRVVAVSMRSERKESPRTDLFYYLPAATAVILTPVPAISFQLAIPISILVYAICQWAAPGLDQEEAQTAAPAAPSPPAAPAAPAKKVDEASSRITLAFAVASMVVVLLWIGFVTGNGRSGPAPDSCPLPPLASIATL